MLASTAAAQDQLAVDAAPFVPVLTAPATGTGSFLALGSQVGTNIDVETPSGDAGCLGVAAAYGFFYVSGRDLGSIPVGKIYQFSTTGVLIGTFPQNQNATVTSVWGHRDLASDGEGQAFSQGAAGGRLWGGQEGGHWVRYTMDAGGALDAGTVLPVVPGLQVVRALARIPGFTPERFVTANFNGPIIEFNEAGTLLGTFGNPGEAFYGFAIDAADPSKLWGNSQTPPVTCTGNPGISPQVHILRMNRPTNYSKDVGTEFCGGYNRGTAGGLGIFDGGGKGINSGFYTFAAIHQHNTDDVDSVSLYDTARVAGTATTQFCAAKTMLFCGPAPLFAVGTSSATATSGFTLSFGPTRGCRSGLLLYSNQPIVPGVPFGGPGDGQLCLVPAGLRRAAPIDSGGSSPSICDGNMSMDFNAFARVLHVAGGCTSPLGQTNPAGFLQTPGVTVAAQGWGRDSVTTGQVLSDGRQWAIGP